MSDFFSNNDRIEFPAEVLVARKLRELRSKQGLSLRSLAERSGLNVNTLSLIENGKSSPSVSTLQQLASALGVPIGTFFETASEQKQVVFTPADSRPLAAFGSTRMFNLGKDLAGRFVQPFLMTLQAGMGSGEQMIVHSGHEFIYCLNGILRYQIDQQEYNLQAGDSLLFEAHLPHCWENTSDVETQFLLILFPSDHREEPGGRHFTLNALKKEFNMKIAFVTEDGKTISQHFGRAPYYLVVSIQEGEVVDREMRDKLGHRQFHEDEHAKDHNHHSHGGDPGSHKKHASMAETIADCKVVIASGMGMGAYESMRQFNIQPLVTDFNDIDAALQAFLQGKLIDHTELLH